MSKTLPLQTAELRPLLHQKILQMSDAEVEQLLRVMQKLEALQLWAEIKVDGAQDRVSGKFDQLNEVIAAVRAEMKVS